jgi:hypothetical protein
VASPRVRIIFVSLLSLGDFFDFLARKVAAVPRPANVQPEESSTESSTALARGPKSIGVGEIFMVFMVECLRKGAGSKRTTANISLFAEHGLDRING